MTGPCSDVRFREGQWSVYGRLGVDSASIQIHDPVVSNDGVTFMSGLGDGQYDVHVREVNVEQIPGAEPDMRIAEVRIILINQSDIDEWNKM